MWKGRVGTFPPSESSLLSDILSLLVFDGIVCPSLRNTKGKGSLASPAVDRRILANVQNKLVLLSVVKGSVRPRGRENESTDAPRFQGELASP